MEAAVEDVLKYGSLPTIMLLISQYERVETLTVLVSGWFNGPVWVAAKSRWVGLQTISIPFASRLRVRLHCGASDMTSLKELNYQRVSINQKKISVWN